MQEAAAAYAEGGQAQREIEDAARTWAKPQRDLHRFASLYIGLLFLVLIPLIAFFALIKSLTGG